MEWLTSYESLEVLLSPTRLFPTSGMNPKSVLHVGCGTSCIGHRLLEKFPEDYSFILNADIDLTFIEEMKLRQQTTIFNSDLSKKFANNCQYLCVDLEDVEAYETNVLPLSPKEGFDLVIDKSTLDCMICSESLASGLITNIFNNLKRGTGIYFVVSFHSEDFMENLLQNENIGLCWKDVECICLERDVENITGFKKSFDQSQQFISGRKRNESVWHDGRFQPTAEYAKSVNVFIFRKCSSSTPVDKESIKSHIKNILDDWYARKNPLMTKSREVDLRRSFQNCLMKSSDESSNRLPLIEAYDVMFTDVEREHLSFDFFLEDWNSFTHSSEQETVTVDEAIQFLTEMQ